MKLRPIAIAVGVVLAGCATRHAPPPRSGPVAPVTAPAPAPAAPSVPAYDYRYRLLTGETTGTEQVFDDGKRTYVRFQSKAPPGLMFFEQDGQPLRATLLEQFAVIDGIHAGVLIRSTTNYSYAAPLDPMRVAAVRVRRADGSPPVAVAAIFRGPSSNVRFSPSRVGTAWRASDMQMAAWEMHNRGQPPSRRTTW